MTSPWSNTKDLNELPVWTRQKDRHSRSCVYVQKFRYLRLVSVQQVPDKWRDDER